MTEKIRREATERAVGTARTVDIAGKSAAEEAVEGRVDTGKKTGEATVLRIAAGKTAADTAHQSIAARSVVRTRVRKERKLTVMRRQASSRRIAVS